MSLRLRKKPPAASLARRRGIEITVLARNRTLYYLANHPLTEDERIQLTGGSRVVLSSLGDPGYCLTLQTCQTLAALSSNAANVFPDAPQWRRSPARPS